MSAESELQRALTLRAEGHDQQAIEALHSALQIDPQLSEAHHQLGNLLRRQGRARAALPHLETAARFDPADPLILLNLGVTLLDLEEPRAAVEIIERALPLVGAMPEAHNLLGCALLASGRVTEARQQLETALGLRPGYPAAHDNLGRVCRAQGRMEEALDHFQTALQAAPSAATHSNALLAANYIPGLGLQDIAAFHKEWDAHHARALAPATPPSRSSREGRRIRLGYVSPDFRQHSVAFFIEPVLAAHDREKFEVFCYHNHANQDDATARLRRHAEHWRDIVSLSDADVAELIRKDGIDILIDLAGHTAGHRLLVFARKPAPIQITWLGYPNTTGLAAMDYRITDAHCLPPAINDAAIGSEKLLRLPGSFCCYQPTADLPPTLPDGAPSDADRPFTFCSFNHLAKLSAPTILVWSEILRQHPDSRLLIKSPGAGDPDTQAHFREKFAQCDIPPERVEFHGEALPIREHLALYQRCDIALDPFPYNGTTTTCEALLMGVPVVTLAGDSHVSRVGVSFLQSVALSDLVAESLEQYCEIAAQLTANSDRRKTLRQTLRETLLTSPLGNAKAFTKTYESALLTL